MKRVAIPIDEDRMCECFEKCSYCEIFEIDGDNVKSIETEVLPLDIAQLPGWANQQGITDIIAYKIDKKIINFFTEEKINLFIGINSDTSVKLIETYINGTLKSNEKIISEITSENE